MDSRVKATRNNNQLWLVLLYDGKQQCVTCIFILHVPQITHLVIHSIDFINLMPSFPSHIHIEAPTFSFTNVFALLLNFVWVKCQIVTSMKGHIEKAVLVIEH
jgi:hypothetical protein